MRCINSFRKLKSITMFKKNRCSLIMVFSIQYFFKSYIKYNSLNVIITNINFNQGRCWGGVGYTLHMVCVVKGPVFFFFFFFLCTRNIEINNRNWPVSFPEANNNRISDGLREEINVVLASHKSLWNEVLLLFTCKWTIFLFLILVANIINNGTLGVRSCHNVNAICFYMFRSLFLIFGDDLQINGLMLILMGFLRQN